MLSVFSSSFRPIRCIGFINNCHRFPSIVFVPTWLRSVGEKCRLFLHAIFYLLDPPSSTSDALVSRKRLWLSRKTRFSRIESGQRGSGTSCTNSSRERKRMFAYYSFTSWMVRGYVSIGFLGVFLQSTNEDVELDTSYRSIISSNWITTGLESSLFCSRDETRLVFVAFAVESIETSSSS